MPMSSKKFQVRQVELEELAKKILVESGMTGLSIERIATDSGYSRPTVYQHFSSKSAALEVVALQTLKHASQLAARAGSFSGTPRERALALVVAYEQLARVYPEDFHIIEFLGFPWVAEILPEKTSIELTKAINGYSETLAKLFAESVEGGSLGLSSGMTPKTLAFQTLSTLCGIYSSILKNRIVFQFSETPDAWREARVAVHAMWDGFRWEVDSSEKGYDILYDRILREIYPDYWVRTQTELLAREVNLSLEAIA